MSDFFAMTSRDRLAEAQQKLAAMQSNLNPETIGDFFTTVSHVMDYMKADLGISPGASKKTLPDAIRQMYDDPDMTTARELSNLSKHARLDTARRPSSPSYTTHSDTAFFEVDQRYTASQDGTNIQFVTVAHRVMEKLQRLLDSSGL